ncbi:MAG: TonB-dependent receptor [Muribaculaceae bacterium]|nr:TonB-dependent receptor [Muribaculaceae bacterium]
MKHAVSGRLCSLILSVVAGCASAIGVTFNVTGEVADSVGEPEIYATVRVYAVADSVKPVSLGTTDGEGRFSQTLKEAGAYRLTVASVGKALLEKEFELTQGNPKVNLGRLVTHDAANELGEIEVVAQRPLVVREIDRLGYDVKADPDASTSNLREILRKVPLVTVDEDGTIKVKGSTDFRIYKNGRPNNSYTKNAKDIFAAIPASSIKKIEVITDPGAREDAEGVGCILNIVTDSETSLKGVVGSANLYMDNYSYYPRPNIWLSTQIDKVTMAVNGGFGVTPKNSRDSEGRSRNFTEYYDTGNRLESQSYSRSPYTNGWMGFESSWEPDTLNLFTVEFNMYGYGLTDPEQVDATRMLASDGSLIYGYNSYAEVAHNKYFDFDGAVNYQRSTHLKGETITLSYRASTTDQHQEAELFYTDMVNCDFGYTGKYYNTRLKFLEQTVQADWSRPYGSHHKVDIGGKAIFRHNHSMSDYIYRGAGVTHDDFTHHTTVGALYADYRLNVGKWNFRAGFRYEYSYLSAKFKEQAEAHDNFSARLHDLVPNAAISWNINDENSLKVSYNRNIRRPGISYLDPTRSISPTAQSFGNPDLESEVYNNVSLNYSLIKSKFNLDFNLGGTLVNNSLAQVQWLENDIQYSTYANIGKRRIASMGLYFQWSINSKTRWMTNLNLTYAYMSQPSPVDATGATVRLSRARWNINPWTRISRDLPWKLEASLSGYFWTGSLNSVYSYSASSSKNIGYSISLSRKFLKDDRLTLRINANNLFGPGSSEYRSMTYNPGYYSEYVSMSNNRRYVGLSVNFRFGSLNVQVKKTASSISNDDLSGRKK